MCSLTLKTYGNTSFASTQKEREKMLLKLRYSVRDPSLRHKRFLKIGHISVSSSKI